MMENKVYRPQIRLYRDRPADKIIIEKIENRNPASVIVFEMNEQGTAGPLPQPIAERSATDNRD